MNGTGKYAAVNGDAYEGSFKNNKYHGEGKYTWEDGSTFEGNFKDGQIISGKYTDASGNVYDCKFTYKFNGERKNGSIRLIKFAQKDTKALKEEKHEKKKESSTERIDKTGLMSKDKTLMTAIRKSKRGAEFKNLYSGAAGTSEKSEQALIAILNFFTNSDAAQIQRIFKTSKLYDATKGDEHLTNMVTGVIKRNIDFKQTAKAASKIKQSSATAAAGAAR